MVLGTLGGVVTGCSIPVSNLFFGQVMDKLNADTTNDFTDRINQICINFVIIAAVNLFSGFVQVFMIYDFAMTEYSYFFGNHRYVAGVRQANANRNDSAKNTPERFFLKILRGLMKLAREKSQQKSRS